RRPPQPCGHRLSTCPRGDRRRRLSGHPCQAAGLPIRPCSWFHQVERSPDVLPGGLSVRTTHRRLLTSTLVAAAALVLLAGCGTGNRQSTTQTPPSPATPATTPQAPAAGERCHARELAAALQQQRPGGGSRYAVLTL